MTDVEIRPFRADIPEEVLTDLRRRIAATRLPTKELVEDRSQGVQLAMLRELARYWTTEYDFQRLEARLNALPQVTTEIDGLDIHFIHVRSRHENALPLIMTHGWPGSIIELLETVGPLTDPTAHGGTVHGRTRRRYRCTVCNKTFSRRAASSRWRGACGRSAELAALTRLLADPACRLLTQQPDTHHLRLGYFGASTGAGAALVAAAERPNVVGAVVSRGGRPDLAGSDLARVRAPTLLIVGGHDLPVIKLNRAAFAQLCVEKRLAIIPGASHLFEEPGTLLEVARLARVVHTLPCPHRGSLWDG
jgi:pimeloyl-ACP methyl ester carboxylesterase